MSFGAGLLLMGMLLNSLIADADADKGLINAKFEEITCRKLIIEDENGNKRGSLYIDDKKTCKLSLYNSAGKTAATLGERVRCKGLLVTGGKEGKCPCCFPKPRKRGNK